jgi:acyl-CoA thioester hydrolase
MRERFKAWLKIEVRWGDMDAFGHVNNARYFTYCESARIRYFEVVGLSEHQRDKVGPSVVSASCNFRRQLRYPETLEVGARAVRLGRSSFTLEYGIFREGSEELVADGASVVVWTDFEAESSTALPAALRARITDLDGLRDG